jgi:hypothetical protein
MEFLALGRKRRLPARGSLRRCRSLSVQTSFVVLGATSTPNSAPRGAPNRSDSVERIVNQDGEAECRHTRAGRSRDGTAAASLMEVDAESNSAGNRTTVTVERRAVAQTAHGWQSAHRFSQLV